MSLLVVNAQHNKAVRGRKADLEDVEWIADLLWGSYLPGRLRRELSELVRYHKGLVRRRTQKVLEGANIKLSSVAGDVVGVSGRAILEAIVDGKDDARSLANLARGRLRKKRWSFPLHCKGW